MEYRVENKYLIYEDEIAYLRARLESIMKKDEHGQNGSYLVRSVYFDDLNDSAYRQNEAGSDDRSKFRIRTYDNDSSFILLEEKSKKKGFTHKESAAIDEKTARSFLKNRGCFNAPMISSDLIKEEAFLFKRLYCNMNTVLLHPVVIVEYERTAFTERSGNVRITFDMNIGASKELDRFFENNIFPVPVLEKGAHILEIKYDEILPGYIKELIDEGILKRTAFSKYYHARNTVG